MTSTKWPKNRSQLKTLARHFEMLRSQDRIVRRRRHGDDIDRDALLEARGSGVSPFCITIDKAAPEYLGHMFGKGNYIFIDRVSSLPAKIADMCRLLTR